MFGIVHSGVATLSCTDCSGSSTASSDITEPGSPFSTASSHSEDSQSNKMAPNTGAHHPPWPWQDAGSCTRTQSKRAKQQTVSAQHDNMTNSDKRQTQQGKITEYFKSQIKANGVKKDTTIKASGDAFKKVHNNLIVNGKQKYYTLIDGPKVILNSKCSKLPPDLLRKLDVHALSKNLLVDKKMRKISNLNGIPVKLLPKPMLGVGNKSKPTQATLTAKTVTNSIDALFMNASKIHTKRTQPGTVHVQKFTQVANLNLKVSSTIVPIVKINNLPSKTNSNNSLSSKSSVVNSTTLSVETGVPTVPMVKLKSCILESLKPTLVRPVSSVGRLHHNADQKKNKVHDTVVDSGGGVNHVSGVSSPLSVCVSTDIGSEPQHEQKSPILSQPKTIRFPAKADDVSIAGQGSTSRRGSDAASDLGACRWAGCQMPQFNTSGALLEHLQVAHVLTQATHETYVCEWIGCKVHGRTSCSRSWLERHVLSHAGNKPFRCIVQGCGCRFNSQQTLERHVNSHFNNSENGQNGSSARKSLDSQGAPKLFKRNGKKLRYRRQPWSGN